MHERSPYGVDGLRRRGDRQRRPLRIAQLAARQSRITHERLPAMAARTGSPADTARLAAAISHCTPRGARIEPTWEESRAQGLLPHRGRRFPWSIHRRRMYDGHDHDRVHTWIRCATSARGRRTAATSPADRQLAGARAASLTCGHVGCCDNSPNKHATMHFHTMQHPIKRSFESDEEWAYCYPDDLFFERVPAGRSA
jgi:hypothetical protein